MSQKKTALETYDLSIGYRRTRHSDVLIAQNLSLQLQYGQLVGLLGPNGAGKSTLLRTLAGMQPVLAGQMRLAEMDMTSISSRDLATHLSIVLTERPNVGLMNGYALVALGRHPYTTWTGRLSDYDEAIIRWAIDAVHAGDIADKPVVELSDGQRQKLMIARALAQETDVIILDEPTAYLDLPRRVEMMQLLQHLAHTTRRAILLSTHDLDLALRSCDKLWLMAEGMIETGTPEDLVLSSAFESTFQNGGLVFDKRTGTFSIEVPRQVEIMVQGEGVPYIWTCRALERQHYQVVDGDCPLRVEIHAQGDSIVWYLTISDYTTSHLSIEHLMVTLGERMQNERHTSTN